MPYQVAPEDALRWPEGFPPESRWKRFFVGVRRLGPDVTFFRKLRDQQAARTPDLMKQWKGDPRRRRTAEVLGKAFQAHLRWSTPYFLPADEFSAIAAGPRFSLVDHGDLQWAVEEAERRLDGPAPDEFWAKARGMTLGEVVDGYIQLSEVRDPPPKQSLHRSQPLGPRR